MNEKRKMIFVLVFVDGSINHRFNTNKGQKYKIYLPVNAGKCLTLSADPKLNAVKCGETIMGLDILSNHDGL